MNSLRFGLGVAKGEFVEEVHEGVDCRVRFLLDEFLVDNPGC
jgi:hypothetical protein